MRPSALTLQVALCAFAGCGDDRLPASAPPAPVAPTPTAPAPQLAASADGLPNPCLTPGVQTITIEAGVVTKTPWGLELTYAIDEDKKLGPGYMFLLKHGPRRWETRRDVANWNSVNMWRGFCWRGGKRPEKRDSQVQLEMAPSCKDGKLAELADCNAVLGAAH
jgi:hypothetical protein